MILSNPRRYEEWMNEFYPDGSLAGVEGVDSIAVTDQSMTMQMAEESIELKSEEALSQSFDDRYNQQTDFSSKEYGLVSLADNDDGAVLSITPSTIETGQVVGIGEKAHELRPLERNSFDHSMMVLTAAQTGLIKYDRIGVKAGQLVGVIGSGEFTI